MKPVVITRMSLAADASKRWDAQYGRSITLYGSNIMEISNNLRGLGKSPDPDMVDKVIGNKSWTRVPQCDGCGSSPEVVVLVGEEPDYESNTAHLCHACLTEAASLSASQGEE